MSEELSASRDKRREMMLEHSMVKLLPMVAVPMIISMLVDSLYNIADVYFVSQLGKTATGAVGINDALSHFIRSISMGFGVGAASYISRLMGGKQENEASRVGTTTLITSMVAMLLLATVALFFVEPLVEFLGATTNTKQYAMDYARFILLVAPFTVGEVVLSQILRSEGSTLYSMIGMVSGCAINVVLDPIFITVLKLEVAGAAIATAISKIISFSILLSPFVHRKTLIELKACFFAPSRTMYKEIARIGIPSFLRTAMLSVATITTNTVAGAFGDSALAAVSVAQRCTHMVASAIMGFGQGLQPVAGYCWGAKHYKRVREAFWTCSAMGAVTGAVLGIIMLISAPTVISLFAPGDEEVIAIGSLMIRSQCVTMVFHVWVIIVNGLFLALGRGVIAGFVGLSRQLICLVPCVLILSYFFGVDGLAIAQAVADIICVCIALPLVMNLMNKIKVLMNLQI